jgi:hypothetical protein
MKYIIILLHIITIIQHFHVLNLNKTIVNLLISSHWSSDVDNKCTSVIKQPTTGYQDEPLPMVRARQAGV